MGNLQNLIEDAFDRRAELNSTTAPADLREAVEETLGLLELGQVRVAEPRDGGWVVNAWLKKAVLLSFRLNDSVIIRDGYTNYFDKVPPKYAEYGENDFLAAGVRVVPPAAAVTSRSAWRTPLRNSTRWSAARRASVASNTASTWLGPSSISSDCSGRPRAWAVRCTMPSGSSAMSLMASACSW